ncbi:hypothetical protein [Paraburkholderia sp. SIMBA_054]|uniref:hypothetical protein n=1 Tax=Paraburkholderia sp. SIMBA_054 TaxID=3085795 RepID=UPI00397DF650
MKKILISALVAVLLAACSDKQASVSTTAEPDTLAGTYIANMGGITTPVIKITGSGAQTEIFTLVDNQWVKSPGPVQNVSKDEFEKAGNVKVDGTFIAVRSGMTFVAEVPKGWSDGKFTTKTGFFTVYPAGPLELTRQ